MALKRRHSASLQLANVRLHVLSATANVLFSKGINIINALVTQSASLQAKILHSYLRSHYLSSIGNKLTMANHLHQFLHPTVATTGEHDSSREPYAALMSLSSVPTSSTIHTSKTATISTYKSLGIQLHTSTNS